MARLISILCLLLAGCASSDVIHFANGGSGYAVRCDWGLSGLNLCYQKAGELCGPLGYRLYGWSGQLLATKPASDEDPTDVEVADLQPKQILIACGPRRTEAR